jgi:hypothetical protein
MKIGVIGTGIVGQVLGAGFAAIGHEVMMGSRDPKQERIVRWLASAGERASSGTNTEAAAFGEIIVLATAWDGVENAIRLAGPDNMTGKVVIDATNPLRMTAAGPELAIGHTDSAGEQVQRWLPDARVVKAFNSIGNQHMVNPSFPGGPPDMFICGNDDSAKRTVTDLLNSFGWSAIDLGGIESARYLEPLGMIWITHLIRSGSGDHAFKLLRK